MRVWVDPLRGTPEPGPRDAPKMPSGTQGDGPAGQITRNEKVSGSWPREADFPALIVVGGATAAPAAAVLVVYFSGTNR